jgi:sodium-independent sulfate anion transporter 11
LRNAFVLIILTIAAWLYTRHRKSKSGKYPIKILQTVPRGLKHVKQPHITHALVSALVGRLPIATIILLLEHIAISKSFGRRNNYKINPNQELIAIGVTNTVGSCFGAYPATGSFSRTALKSKCGVRTPLAGISTAVVVIVALYGLTPAFFWIPTAALSAVIIHAVADLVASPAQVYSFWRVSPLEFAIWLAAVLVTVFSTIENGIYTSIATSLALLLIRVAHPRGNFLGRITVRAEHGAEKTRDVYVPLDDGRDDGSGGSGKGVSIVNPDVEVHPPSPGVLIYRLEESYIYPNASHVDTVLVDYVKAHMRRGADLSRVNVADRPWNDPGPTNAGAEAEQAQNAAKPELHAIVLDFSAISHIDTTGVQSLIDARSAIERWTDHPVEFHFASILSPWIRRALVSAGFGTGLGSRAHPLEVASVVPYRGGSVPTADEKEGEDAATAAAATGVQDDLEVVVAAPRKRKAGSDGTSVGSGMPLLSTDTPFFHIDLAAAVCAAERALFRYNKS